MTHFRYGAIRPMRVLLVEDDELLGSGICDALERTRYTVEWVRDGAQALEALRGSGVDLAVLDLGLPRMDGMEVLRRAREAGVTTPVLVLSARDTTLQRIGGLDAGADEQLTIASIDVAADRLATMASLKALVLGEAMVPA